MKIRAFRSKSKQNFLFRVVDLFENNVFATQLFARFESKHKIKEDYGLFNKFTAYSNEEA
jgi:hypothetical protein